MPFVSKSQWRAFAAMLRRGEITKKTFDEWARSSPPYKSLPEHAPKRRSSKKGRKLARVLGKRRRKKRDR